MFGIKVRPSVRVIPPPRRPLYVRIVCRVRALYLRWCLDSNQQWIKAAHDDGIVDGESMREWRRQADAMRVQIEMLERECR